MKKPRKPVPRISAKKLQQLGGKRPHSTITAKPKPVRKVNRKRRAAEWARAYDSPEFVAWIRSRPSVVSGKGPCVAAHTTTGGIGRKSDARSIVPLTDAEHRELHTIGIQSFEVRHGVSLAFHAPRTWAAWLAQSSPPMTERKHNE